MNSEQINFVNLWLDKQAIGFIFPIHYSEQINFVNLWLDKQAIGFIFPIHYSEQINFVNLWLDKQAIGFIFPIHYKKWVNILFTRFFYTKLEISIVLNTVLHLFWSFQAYCFKTLLNSISNSHNYSKSSFL